MKGDPLSREAVVKERSKHPAVYFGPVITGLQRNQNPPLQPFSHSLLSCWEHCDIQTSPFIFQHLSHSSFPYRIHERKHECIVTS